MVARKLHTVEKRMIPSSDRDIWVLIMRPTENARPQESTPGIPWLHGGGHLHGMYQKMLLPHARLLVEKYGAVVVAPEYRTAFEKPFPADLEDCYAALLFLKVHADELGINDAQIMVGGESAGGGLTVATCLLARDLGEVNIAYQMPLYPMLDDRTVACDDELDGLAHVWFAENNKMAWEAVLGERRGTDEELPCEAPARNESFEGLAPAFLEVGELDLFRDETIEYAKRLMAAHVPAELHVLTGLTHTFDTFPLPIADKAFEYRSYVISQL